MTDSQSAAHALESGTPTNPMVYNIQCSAQLLRERGSACKFLWIRGHNGIHGNERADELAKDAALKTKTQKLYSEFPLSYAKFKIKEAILEEWDQRYKNSDTGKGTRLFFRSIKEAKEFGKKTTPTFELTQILTGHGANLSYLHRFKLKDSPACPCDKLSDQTVKHLLLDCPMFTMERWQITKECQRRDIDFTDISDVIQIIPLRKIFINYAKNIISKIKEQNK